jgi:hypothetical protein
MAHEIALRPRVSRAFTGDSYPVRVRSEQFDLMKLQQSSDAPASIAGF